jgi:hypothetical protein
MGRTILIVEESVNDKGESKAQYLLGDPHIQVRVVKVRKDIFEGYRQFMSPLEQNQTFDRVTRLREFTKHFKEQPDQGRQSNVDFEKAEVAVFRHNDVGGRIKQELVDMCMLHGRKVTISVVHKTQGVSIIGTLSETQIKMLPGLVCDINKRYDISDHITAVGNTQEVNAQFDGCMRCDCILSINGRETVSLDVTVASGEVLQTLVVALENLMCYLCSCGGAPVPEQEIQPAQRIPTGNTQVMDVSDYHLDVVEDDGYPPRRVFVYSRTYIPRFYDRVKAICAFVHCDMKINILQDDEVTQNDFVLYCIFRKNDDTICELDKEEIEELQSKCDNVVILNMGDAQKDKHYGTTSQFLGLGEMVDLMFVFIPSSELKCIHNNISIPRVMLLDPFRQLLHFYLRTWQEYLFKKSETVEEIEFEREFTAPDAIKNDKNALIPVAVMRRMEKEMDDRIRKFFLTMSCEYSYFVHKFAPDFSYALHGPVVPAPTVDAVDETPTAPVLATTSTEPPRMWYVYDNGSSATKFKSCIENIMQLPADAIVEKDDIVRVQENDLAWYVIYASGPRLQGFYDAKTLSVLHERCKNVVVVVMRVVGRNGNVDSFDRLLKQSETVFSSVNDKTFDNLHFVFGGDVEKIELIVPRECGSTIKSMEAIKTMVSEWEATHVAAGGAAKKQKLE